MRARTVARWLLVAFYALAGVLHIALPRPFLGITPDWVPFPAAVILLTGLAELAGAAALAQGASARLRAWGGIGLAAYAVCVFPANIHHFALDMARSDGGLGLAYHVPRMFAQPLLVWLALWSSGATDWPFRGKGSSSSRSADRAG
ncbi:DoxX family protein [Novosphingobium huizhouense]|uniref:DoxX family protein n=1 Tax=Novosphingobium huizhouense TaxID=2866625 RepID=UPI001CD82AF6|nr:DoxX family protein [Novosphingobium huizhouense]